jgi:hypothetical protein
VITELLERKGHTTTFKDVHRDQGYIASSELLGGIRANTLLPLYLEYGGKALAEKLPLSKEQGDAMLCILEADHGGDNDRMLRTLLTQAMEDLAHVSDYVPALEPIEPHAHDDNAVPATMSKTAQRPHAPHVPQLPQLQNRRVLEQQRHERKVRLCTTLAMHHVCHAIHAHQCHVHFRDIVQPHAPIPIPIPLLYAGIMCTPSHVRPTASATWACPTTPAVVSANTQRTRHVPWQRTQRHINRSTSILPCMFTAHFNLARRPRGTRHTSLASGI